MSHTPGPWEANYIGNGEWEVLANGPDRDDVAGICIVAGGLGTSIEDGRDHESDANARLIAALPDLLVAAESVIACGALPRERHLCGAIKELEKAVKKAKGE